MGRLFLKFIVFVLITDCYAQIPTYENVDYVGDGAPGHLMDIYIPSGITQPAKTVIYIPGGAWKSGSKSKAMKRCQKLFDANYVVVGIDYRRSKDSVFPAQIYDCKTAIRFLKRNAYRYRIDTCNMGVVGTSAGGHLSALVGTSMGEQILEGLHLGSTGVSSDIHSVADYYGPTDCLQMDEFIPSSCTNTMAHDSEKSPESKLLGCKITTCPSRVAQANPITYINGNEPPFSIHHGDADCMVASHQSQMLHDSLISNGQNSNLTIYPGGGHGDFINSAVLDSMLVFFDNTLINVCASSGKNNLQLDPLKFKVFPNPVSNTLIFSSTCNIQYNLTINNIFGQKLLEVYEVRNGYGLDFSKLLAGIYFVTISNDIGNITTKKVLKR